MHIADMAMILAAWRNGLDTFELARKFMITEPLAYSILHRALDHERAIPVLTNSAADIRPKPPGSSPRQGAVPSASGPGGTLLSEKQPAE